MGQARLVKERNIFVAGCAMELTSISREVPIIGVGRFADNWYWPISTLLLANCRLTVCKYKFLFLLPEVNKHETGFHYR